MWHAIIAIIIMFSALKTGAEIEYFKNGQKGAFYEYDLAGTPKERYFRELTHHASQSIKRPAIFVYKSGKRGYKGYKKSRDVLEQYLKGSAKNAEQQQRLARALTDWENIMSQAPRDGRTPSPQGVLYVPYESWRLFKYSLYLVGFALPHALKKGVKNIIYNTCSIKRD